MKRLFVAIELPRSVTRSLAKLDPEIRGARWLEPKQMHLTLSFLGNVSERHRGRVEKETRGHRLEALLSPNRWPWKISEQRPSKCSLDRGWVGPPSPLSITQAGPRSCTAIRNGTRTAVVSSARHPRSLPRCSRPIAQVVSQDARGIRRRNGSRRNVLSQFQSPHINRIDLHA